jgi:porin
LPLEPRPRTSARVALLHALLAAVLPLPAEADGAAAQAARYLRDTPRLLGDPGGARSQLEALGVSLELYFNHSAGLIARGGHGEAGELHQSGSADLFALADFEELGWIPGARLLLHAKSNYHRNVNPDVRAQSDPIDDADFDEPIYVAQLWLEQDLWRGRVSLRAGYLDQQVSFDRNAYANNEDRQFLSTFLDNDPVVPLRTGFGALLVVRPWSALELAAGVSDADNVPRVLGIDTAFDGFSSLVGYLEATLRVSFPGPRGRLPGSYRLGAFRDGTRRAEFGSGALERGHWGGWGSFDQLVFAEGGESGEGLGLFLRFGVADADVNAVAALLSGGLEYTGLLPGRGRDALGLGAYASLPNDEPAADLDGERGLELYYRLQLAPWLALTPDVQWIHDPGGRAAARDAWVLALRTRLAF